MQSLDNSRRTVGFVHGSFVGVMVRQSSVQIDFLRNVHFIKGRVALRLKEKRYIYADKTLSSGTTLEIVRLIDDRQNSNVVGLFS